MRIEIIDVKAFRELESAVYIIIIFHEFIPLIHLEHFLFPENCARYQSYQKFSDMVSVQITKVLEEVDTEGKFRENV